MYAADVVAWLSRPQKLKEEVAVLKNMLESLDDSLGVGSVDYARVNVSGGVSVPVVESLALERVKMSADLQQKEKELAAVLAEVLQIVQAAGMIRAVYAQLLQLHFIDGLPWSAVIDTVNFSRSHTFALYSQALRTVGKEISRLNQTNSD